MWVSRQQARVKVKKKTLSVETQFLSYLVYCREISQSTSSLSLSLMCTRTCAYTQDEKYTMFLVAGYARYSRPYVWIRSNHERLVQFSSDSKEEKDFPLQLTSTTKWMEGGMFAMCTTTSSDDIYTSFSLSLEGIAVWDIIAEVVQVCTVPCPPNPFAVDFDYFDALPLSERALSSGAMVNFLRQLQASGPHRYDRRGGQGYCRSRKFHLGKLSSYKFLHR